VARAQAPIKSQDARLGLPGRSAGLKGPTFTFEDDRFRYEEQRFMTLGFLGGATVSIVHTESEDLIHVISFRKATRHEEIILYQTLKD
jgi:uncharacterized DUF497 family protein